MPHISQTNQNPYSLTKQKLTTNPNTIVQPTNPRSLSGWIQLYYLLVVQAQSKKTRIAKKQDLHKFLNFYRKCTKTDDIYYWISPVTKKFQEHLQQAVSPISGKPYQATTINRILATIKHFANWIVARYPLPDGNPTQTIKNITMDEPEWLGLSQEVVTALKKACQARLDHQKSNRQNPALEAAIFYCLLYTGLRESELININKDQYHHSAFHQVKRKNNHITRVVTLPLQATTFLDSYLVTNSSGSSGLDEPLFISNRKCRLSARGVIYICERLAKHAKQYLDTNQELHVSPHQLRHTFLKRITDKYGVHYAQKVSGNTSIKEIFRYAKPSQAEIESCVKTLFDDD
jgi:integrase/recombinase XerD